MSNSLELEKIGIEVDEEIPYTIIENYIFDIEGLSANKKLFLLMLRRYAGAGKKPAFPSYKKLMNNIGSTSRATIMKCIDFFIWLKWLERINRADPATHKKISNYYMLSLKNIDLVLKHFEKNNIKFREVEKYFESKYKDTDTRKQLLNTPCKYFKE